MRASEGFSLTPHTEAQQKGPSGKSQRNEPAYLTKRKRKKKKKKKKKKEKKKPTPAAGPFRRQVNQPPVVLEDLGTGVASFTDNGPRTASLFQRTVRPILSRRPLT